MQFEYEIKYSKRKTLNITVERDRKIIVRAPENTSAQKIEEVLQSKKQWLKENGLPDLEITNVKDYGCIMLIDDIANQMIANTGTLISSYYLDLIRERDDLLQEVLQEFYSPKGVTFSTIDKIKDSDVIKIKIKEVINQLDKINPGKIVKDNHVMVLMLSYELLKEIKRQIKE